MEWNLNRQRLRRFVVIHLPDELRPLHAQPAWSGSDSYRTATTSGLRGPHTKITAAKFLVSIRASTLRAVLFSRANALYLRVAYVDFFLWKNSTNQPNPLLDGFKQNAATRWAVAIFAWVNETNEVTACAEVNIE